MRSYGDGPQPKCCGSGKVLEEHLTDESVVGHRESDFSDWSLGRVAQLKPCRAFCLEPDRGLADIVKGRQGCRTVWQQGADSFWQSRSDGFGDCAHVEAVVAHRDTGLTMIVRLGPAFERGRTTHWTDKIPSGDRSKAWTCRRWILVWVEGRACAGSAGKDCAGGRSLISYRQWA